MQIVIGNWSYEFNGDLQANNEIRIKQYNIKGRPDYNYYIYKRVVQLPAKNNITIDPIDTSQRVIRGKGEPRAKIEIYDTSPRRYYNVDVDSSRKLEL